MATLCELVDAEPKSCSVTACEAMRRLVQINVVVILILLCIFMKGFNFSTLEVVTDDELLNLVRTEKYVVVLFSEYLSLVRS